MTLVHPENHDKRFHMVAQSSEKHKNYVPKLSHSQEIHSDITNSTAQRFAGMY
jgi:hypothetical protein